MKNLCTLKKDDVKENFAELKTKAINAKYICKKCLRVSDDKSDLCKAEKLKD